MGPAGVLVHSQAFGDDDAFDDAMFLLHMMDKE
jgi:hypothetical protein